MSDEKASQPWRKHSDERARLKEAAEAAQEARRGETRECAVSTGLYARAEALGSLLEKKNAAYGNSFAQCGDFLAMLYPDGVKPEQYQDMLCIVRVFDKLKRIATDKDAMGENPWQDVAGYAILALENSGG